MNKGVRLIKRLIALFLVLIFSIESFAAVVSDNDGSAFITKAKFDSLKNNFQNQIDQYNTSIDSKIDGAIASYLAGIKVDKKTKQGNLLQRFSSRVDWGTIPIKATSTKYVINSFAALFFQGDGYMSGSPGGLSCSYKAGSYTDTSTGTGTYNLFQKENSKKYYYGYTSNEYCQTNYNFSGVFMTTTAGSLSGKNVPSSFINVVEQISPADTSFTWGNGSDTHTWYKSTPNTSGWSAKYSYWTRSDGYHNGTVSVNTCVMSSGQVSTSSYDMIDFNNRVGGYSETGAVTPFRLNVSLNYNLSTTIMYQTMTNYPSMNASHSYFYPQRYSTKPSELYSWGAYLALGRDIYLYQGLPLFKATANGKVKMVFTLYTTDASAANASFYLRDNTYFDNSSSPVGTQEFDVWSFDSAGNKTLVGENYVWFYVPRSTKVEIQFDAKKDHEYIFKLVPSNTSYYAYLGNFEDIMLTEE